MAYSFVSCLPAYVTHLFDLGYRRTSSLRATAIAVCDCHRLVSIQQSSWACATPIKTNEPIHKYGTSGTQKSNSAEKKSKNTYKFVKNDIKCQKQLLLILNLKIKLKSNF
jgi:hypothetical protein